MRLIGNTGPAKRFSRVFNKRTFLLIQVSGVNVIQIGKSQSEATFTTVAAADGIVIGFLGAAAISDTFKTWWQGEFWYGATADDTAFTLVIADETS